MPKEKSHSKCSELSLLAQRFFVILFLVFLFCITFNLAQKDLFLESNLDADEVPIPTWKHSSFYDFLEISPSYYLVYLYKNNKKSLSTIQQIEQYERVIETYDLVGDIYNQKFEDWWRNGAYKLFEPTQKFEALVKIDLTKSLSYNQALLKHIFETKKSRLRLIPATFKFEKNKIQELVLRNRRQLIYQIINNFYQNIFFQNQTKKKIPKWFLAYFRKDELLGRTSGLSHKNIKNAITFKTGVHSYTSDFKDKIKSSNLVIKDGMIQRPTLYPAGIKKTSSKNTTKAKRYYSMLMSKHQREALILAENAARGIFPSKEKLLKNYPKFDFANLRNAPEFQLSHPKNDFLLVDFKTMYRTGSRTRTIRKFYEDQLMEAFKEHELLERINTDLKPLIEERSDALARKKYQQLKQIGKKPTKPTPRRSGSLKG